MFTAEGEDGEEKAEVGGGRGGVGWSIRGRMAQAAKHFNTRLRAAEVLVSWAGDRAGEPS
jgi:hypothetical protein